MEYAQSIESIYGGRDKLGGKWWWIVFGNVGMGELSAGGLGFVAESSFEVGITTLPKQDESDEFYLASNTESFVGIPKTAKNPAGAWMLLKYSVTEGCIAEELSTYNKAPNKYISQYIYHKPTREKLYNALEGLVEDKLIDFMKERDELVAKCNRNYHKSPVHSSVMSYFNENYPKMLDHKIAPQDFINNLQSYSEQLIKDFIKQKEEEHWVFEEGKDGVYVGDE